MPSSRIHIAEGVSAGGGAPLLLIAGPDSIESESHALRMAAALAALASARGMKLVYKSSFDKANRTSGASFRGVGIDEGMAILARVKGETGLPELAAVLAPVVDLLQVPAMLSRQTDMLVAAARTGRAVNVKKGQFLAPWDAGQAVAKVKDAGNQNVMLTERGVTFGYNNLVVDFRALPRMRALGVPVCFDATHSVQLPGGQGKASGGEREFVGPLARAAVAVGVDALFFEVHDDPDHALCDGPSQIPLGAFAEILDGVLAIDAAARKHQTPLL
jgi:2-dehydro-3-deoxyphosphooctonate aldolase (KDO 8-P synthase)